MKKILVTGGSGLLGRYLAKAKPNDVELMCAGYSSRESNIKIDLTDKLSLYRLFSDFKADVIINSAGLGNVDFCELVPYVSDAVNYEGTKNIIDIIEELKPLNKKPLFIHISSNAVYDGNNPLYNEDSRRRPISKYGFNNKLAEEYVQFRYDNWIIVRPFMLFGYPYVTGRDNWLTILIQKLENDEEIKLIDDIIWQPTSARFAAKVIYSLIDKSNESYNLSQGSSMSLYEFGLMVQSIFAPDKDLIKPISHTEFQTIAKRPINTSYDVTKLKEIVDIPTVTEELEQFHKEYKGGTI